MNVFNRVMMIILIILMLIASLITVVLPFWVIDTVIQFLRTVRAGLEQMYVTGPLVFLVGQIVVAVALVLILGTLFVLEVRRGRPAAVEVVTAEGGKAKVLVDSISMRLSYHLDQLADVISVKPRVRAKGNVVHVDLEVETSPDVQIPMKTQEILDVTREVVEQRMGLKLGRVNVRIRHVPYPEETGAPPIVDAQG